MTDPSWPKPPEHKQELCSICDGRGVLAILDKNEHETIETCPVCNGLGTV